MDWLLIAIQWDEPPFAAVPPDNDHSVRPRRKAGGPPEGCPTSFLVALIRAVTWCDASRDESGIGGTSILPEQSH
ncbi:hypothetical protein [Streptomyces sp. CRN 30]|uniref:hypothetical protein n=1 Tax=Streptomyces sp. CRN 30 TaxID=3075613 RepID=UPI002A7EC9D0|nr:hypothetical protein [Streptomyces sp. CRN 30]